MKNFTEGISLKLVFIILTLISTILLSKSFVRGQSLTVFSDNPQNTLCIAIGNGKYKHFPVLTSPAIDIKAMEQIFGQLNCTNSIVKADLTLQGMKDLFNTVENQVDGKYVFLFISAHGVQINGKLYLTGTDSSLKNFDLEETSNEESLWSQVIDLDYILQSIESAVIKIVIIDACRTAKTASISKQRQPPIINPPNNTIIVYSTNPGNTAKGGVYTTSLVKHLLDRYPIQNVLERVNEEVKKDSKGEQIPIVQSSYSPPDSLYFRKPNPDYPKMVGTAVNFNTVNFLSPLFDETGKVKMKTFSGTNFTEVLSDGTEMEMVLITKPECYNMGASSEKLRLAKQDAEKYLKKEFFTNKIEELETEQPMHHVCFSKDFAIAKYEVTQRLYKAIMGRNPSFIIGDDLPVTFVSYEEAIEFCRKLSEYTKRKYRLLSEAEWEYLAQGAKNEDIFAFGMSLPSEKFNYNADFTFMIPSKLPNDLSKLRDSSNYSIRPRSVFESPLNRFGLANIPDNVREIVSDFWNPNYQLAPDSGNSWETGEKLLRVVRGGSYLLSGWYARNTSRSYIGKNTKRIDVGFRVAMDLEINK